MLKIKKRKVNRSFNCFIAPKASDIEHIERRRSAVCRDRWIDKRCPK